MKQLLSWKSKARTHTPCGGFSVLCRFRGLQDQLISMADGREHATALLRWLPDVMLPGNLWYVRRIKLLNLAGQSPSATRHFNGQQL